MILAGTGHRPMRLGGYGSAVGSKLRALANFELTRLRPQSIISGMALGWDTALAQEAIHLRIPFTAAVPFPGYEALWPVASRGVFDFLLARAAKVHYVSSGGYTSKKLQIRNEWMVDNCTAVLALWDGTPSGTGNCVRYAGRRGKQIINCWDLWNEKDGDENDF